MMADPPIQPRERVLLGIAGMLLGGLFVCAPKLLHWWLIWSSAQLDALAALLGWR